MTAENKLHFETKFIANHSILVMFVENILFYEKIDYLLFHFLDSNDIKYTSDVL